ncbi:helix-turn-helix domain-containing protein [Streptomyces mirabilis]|uniref:helix-turn-helix domain-containing protein n=1 Tax=Streptomyces mirabilis TaxID=68239 RepID=UPI0033BED3CE
MANIKSLDPGASPLHYFGAELRRLREEAGLTLEQVGKRVFLTGSMIGQIETAARVPKDEHVPRLDTAVDGKGALVRAWILAQRSRLPGWFQRVARMEATAKGIHVFQAQLVHGLLQTPAYAEAVLGVMSTRDLDTNVEARIARQEILRREEPPVFWAVFGEGVLYQEIGGPATMRGQLARLLEYADVDEVQIQILPYSAGAHTGLPGSFNIYSFDDQASVAYMEGYEDGWATINPKEVRARSLRYDLLRASALSPADSMELIARVMKERYEHRPDSDADSDSGPRPVA